MKNPWLRQWEQARLFLLNLYIRYSAFSFVSPTEACDVVVQSTQ